MMTIKIKNFYSVFKLFYCFQMILFTLVFVFGGCFVSICFVFRLVCLYVCEKKKNSSNSEVIKTKQIKIVFDRNFLRLYLWLHFRCWWFLHSASFLISLQNVELLIRLFDDISAHGIFRFFFFLFVASYFLLFFFFFFFCSVSDKK